MQVLQLEITEEQVTQIWGSKIKGKDTGGGVEDVGKSTSCTWRAIYAGITACDIWARDADLVG